MTPPWLHYHGERLIDQDGPFDDYQLVDGTHYGRLAVGPYKGMWLRLTASPVEMGLIRG